MRGGVARGDGDDHVGAIEIVDGDGVRSWMPDAPPPMLMFANVEAVGVGGIPSRLRMSSERAFARSAGKML